LKDGDKVTFMVAGKPLPGHRHRGDARWFLPRKTNRRRQVGHAEKGRAGTHWCEGWPVSESEELNILLVQHALTRD